MPHKLMWKNGPHILPICFTCSSASLHWWPKISMFGDWGFVFGRKKLHTERFRICSLIGDVQNFENGRKLFQSRLSLHMMSTHSRFSMPFVDGNGSSLTSWVGDDKVIDFTKSRTGPDWSFYIGSWGKWKCPLEQSAQLCTLHPNFHGNNF